MTRGAAQRVLRWPLWSWRNLAVSTVVVLALLAVLGRLTDPGAPASAASAPAAVEQRDAHAPTAAAVVPTPSPTATASSSAPTGAAPSDRGSGSSSPVRVATGFVAAWASTSHGEDGWLAGMTPWATPELLASLQGTDPVQVPASRITGDAALRSTTGPTAVVSVPTDGGRIQVTLKQHRGTWAAAALAPEDAPPGAPTPSLGPLPTGSGG